jgi:hypothetical protein
MAMTAAFAFQEPLNAVASAEFSSLAAASMLFLQTGPAVASRQVEENMARFQNPQTAYETAFRFQRQDGAGLQWVSDTKVNEANGYAVLAAFATSEGENCELIRDILGNPFHPISINPNWLTPTVTNLATVAYQERNLHSRELDNIHLAVLADALEDAGCDNQDLLGHLRSSGPHVCGCFALDLLLGKS